MKTVKAIIAITTLTLLAFILSGCHGGGSGSTKYDPPWIGNAVKSAVTDLSACTASVGYKNIPNPSCRLQQGSGYVSGIPVFPDGVAGYYALNGKGTGMITLACDGSKFSYAVLKHEVGHAYQDCNAAIPPYHPAYLGQACNLIWWRDPTAVAFLIAVQNSVRKILPGEYVSHEDKVTEEFVGDPELWSNPLRGVGPIN